MKAWFNYLKLAIVGGLKTAWNPIKLGVLEGKAKVWKKELRDRRFRVNWAKRGYWTSVGLGVTILGEAKGLFCAWGSRVNFRGQIGKFLGHQKEEGKQKRGFFGIAFTWPKGEFISPILGEEVG